MSIEKKRSEVSGLKVPLVQLIEKEGHIPLEDDAPCPPVAALVAIVSPDKYAHLMGIEIEPGTYTFQFIAHWLTEIEYAGLTPAQAEFWTQSDREECIGYITVDAEEIMQNWDEGRHGQAPAPSARARDQGPWRLLCRSGPVSR